MDVERVFREEYGRAVAVLVHVFGDIDVAEEAVQDAFMVAAALAARRAAGEPGGLATRTGGRSLLLYEQLRALSPTPVVALNRAVAVAEVEGPEAALALVEELGLDGYHVFHAVRADLLRRVGRGGEAPWVDGECGGAGVLGVAALAAPRHRAMRG